MSRLIAGSHGGHRLVTPAGTGTRPTADRVREALFSALAAWAGGSAGPADQALAGLAFLDLYAGSGAVGLEAASRGAAPVLLVEADRRTARTATRNITEVGLGATLRVARVEELAQRPCPQTGGVRSGYGIVVADPPYDLPTEQLDAVVADLVRHGWVAPDGLVVLERSARSPDPRWPPGFETWQRRYGETVLHFGSR